MNGEKIMSMTIRHEKEMSTKDGKKYRIKTMCDIRILDSLLFTLLGLGPLTEILKAQHQADNLEEGFPITFQTFSKRIYQDSDGEITARFSFDKKQIALALRRTSTPTCGLTTQVS